MDAITELQKFVPVWVGKLPHHLQIIIAGAVVVHLIGLIAVLTFALRPSSKGKPAFSAQLKTKGN